ncbi:MAG: peptidase S41, partial [Flavobacteriaceae bacterium]|nr:peptidase S41 [Flavobacteriaceae bacterium]
MKRFLSIFALATLLFVEISCTKDDNNNIPDDVEIQNFIWKGLNAFYFWQQDIDNLADDKFSSQNQLNTFLEGYSQPDELFYSLLNDYPNVDKYSWIVDDYIALEQLLQQGVSGTTGAEFGLVLETGSQTDIYGYIKYIIPGSDAASKNNKRG